MGLKLHSIVRDAIHFVHENEAIKLYLPSAKKNNKGIIETVYSAPLNVFAQIQAEKISLDLQGKSPKHRPQCTIYLDMKNIEMSLITPIGAIIMRNDNSYWRINEVEEFEKSSKWLKCIAYLQKGRWDFLENTSEE